MIGSMLDVTATAAAAEDTKRFAESLCWKAGRLSCSIGFNGSSLSVVAVVVAAVMLLLRICCGVGVHG